MPGAHLPSAHYRQDKAYPVRRIGRRSDDRSKVDRRVPHKPNARLGSSGTSLVPHSDKPFPILTPDFVLFDREFDGTGFIRSLDQANQGGRRC